MYLSRILVDTKNRQKIADLSHLGAYHNWVERSFPQRFHGDIRPRKLWRIDTVDHQDYLMIVSPEKPNVKKLERYGVEGSAQIMDYSAVLDKLQEGMQLRFKAVLHPTYNRRRPGDLRGKITQCLSYPNQIEYLVRHSHKNGFSLNTSMSGNYDFTVTGRDVHYLKKHDRKTTYIRSVCYEGILTIEDIDSFRRMLCKGLGRKKAYGCGMMTVAPI